MFYHCCSVLNDIAKRTATLNEVDEIIDPFIIDPFIIDPFIIDPKLNLDKPEES